MRAGVGAADALGTGANDRDLRRPCARRAAARVHRPRRRRHRRRRGDDGEDPRRLRALWLRGGRDAVHRIYRGARQVPARPGPAERRRVLVQGRRRAMAVAALRLDRAARPLCRRKLREAAKALSQLSRRLGVPQREAGAGTLPPVHAIRRRHGRRGSPAADAEICMMAADCLEALGIKRGDYVIKVNNRKVLDGVMEAIGLGGAGERRAAADGAARDRQARPARAGGRACVARRRTQGRERRLHQGRGA